MSAEIKATKEQFEAFVQVQESGATNMFDVGRVIQLSDYVLDKEVVLNIMQNYTKYKEMYAKN